MQLWSQTTQLAALLSQGIPSSESHPRAVPGPAQSSCTAKPRGCSPWVFDMKREEGFKEDGWVQGGGTAPSVIPPLPREGISSSGRLVVLVL